MQVSRIEIFGFKSFMDRLILPIDNGVTGVVGPNGCGKSNIVDALRWVLGESRAKSLRGGLLEDVIFNGTDKLRPLGLAEVTITLRAQEENFFAELSSQELEAEALVEQAEAELEESSEDSQAEDADPTESFQSPPSEEESLIVSEGEEGENPRLTVIEGNLDKNEQTPTITLKDKIESSGQTDASAALVNRFSWLKAATEVQVTRRLYRSGESEFFINRVPCRLKDMKELFRAVGLGARTHTIVAQGEVSRVVTAKSDERRRILEEAAGVQGFREKINGAERRLSETAQNMARIEDIIKEVSRQVNSLKRQASRAKNRKQLKEALKENELLLFKDSLARAERSLNEQEKLFQEAKIEEQQVETKLQSELADEEKARGELLEADVQADEVRSIIDNLKEELANRARQRVQRQERLAELKAYAIAKETETKRLEERERQLLERQSEGKKIIDSILTEEQQLALKLEEHDESLADRIKELELELKQLTEDSFQKEQTARSNRDKLISARSRLESLQEQLRAASPLTTLEELDSHQDTASQLHDLKGAKMLIEALEVPEEYLRAVQAVLSERAAYLLVENPHETGTAILEALKNISKDDSVGIGLFDKSVSIQTSPAETPGFKSLRSIVQCEPQYQDVVGSLFSNVFYVETLESAVSYFKGHRDSKVTLVTSTGDVLTNTSLYCFRHDSGLVSITNEVQELEKVCDERQAEQERVEHELTDLRADKVHLEERLTQTRRAYQEQQRRKQEIGSQLGALKGRREVEQRQVEQQVQDNLRIQDQLKETQYSIVQFKKEQSELQAELAQMEGEDESQMHAEVRARQEKYLELDEIRREGREALSNMARAVEQTRNARDKVRVRISQIELAKEKVRLEVENVRDRAATEYGEEVLESLQEGSIEERIVEDDVRVSAKEEAQKIRARIMREGDVDPTSIERLDEESERLDDLEKQRKDLVRAELTLKQTIAKLRDTSEKRFLKTFEAVRENFAMLIPRLFGGGKGSLELTDMNNPLESGLEIIARPPGKKLKSIELLSGGEKALCATALIVAMFLERPSPLCVLDEVDAPLDDANLMRFISIVKEMSAKTQFIVITHNKATMAAADTLVGVTMEQPGASKVISVSLQEAYDQVA